MSTTGKVSVGTPTRLRSFDPVRLADLEYRVWVGYYLRQWPRVLIAAATLARPATGRYFTGGGVGAYSLTPAAWHALVAADAARATAPGRSH